ncbi:hypothetical protein GALMADRAFT_1345373 [Galerina marginata CBS 339.88]|uniref:Uncharacterized protein n=1 Tax=Galerina marginata (strain CBS 339.88) TaxID=685588 RepID=A0A067SV53_GALM3|nr:hypothetical protein GALMADRAFT_1345373 [Galerina marginata CBS 339.88]
MAFPNNGLYSGPAATTPGLPTASVIQGSSYDSQKISTSSSSEITQRTQFESVRLAQVAFTEVPWMRFKIIAEPDMQVFATDKRLQGFIQTITRSTVDTVTQEIMKEVTTLFEQAVVHINQSINQSITTRMATVTDTVIAQLSALTISGGVTEFQSLNLNAKIEAEAQLGNGAGARV